MADSLERGKELFWQLLEPVQKKLYNFIHKALAYGDEGEDVFQEVLVRAFRYFPSFDRGRDFATWLFAIAHNEVKKHYKVKRQARVDSLSDLATDPPAAAADPLVPLVYGVAETLPGRQREVFYLFYYNGFSVAEIAGITGLREGNVKFILNRAREAVKSALEVTHVR